MTQAAPRRILLGVSGGVAAFKAPELVRRLRERGHEVRCALTPAATSFVAPLTLEVLSGQPVAREEYLEPGGGGEEAHIAAAAWAEAFCIAPATAHTLGALALGLAPNFLTTTALAFRGPLVVAPAMHSAMWSQPAVQENLARLRARGVRQVGPVEGPLASGESGMGRMADVAEIVRAVEACWSSAELAGRTVVVSAGPTQEPLDPVRFLGNRSSGKMGFALAAEAARRGARTLLVAGPVALATPPGVERIDVETALEMAAALEQVAAEADLVLMTAAVADFRPRHPAPTKIKRQAGPPQVELVANPDLLADLARLAPRALRVGFAAETGIDPLEAGRKLAAKGAHLLVANDVSRPDIGFGSDDNEVTLFRPESPPIHLPKRSKRELAVALFDHFVRELGHVRPETEPVRP